MFKTNIELLERTQPNPDTVMTKVKFTFNDDEVVTVDIPHFQPQSDDDILVGINNRSVSERRKIYGSIVVE